MSSAVYKIVNTVTGDFYVGSSRNVEKRWADHKYPSYWKDRPNTKLYLDMQKYGVDKFKFQILAPVMPEYLKQVEQELIDLLQPTYNSNRAKGWNKESREKYQKKYRQSERGKEIIRKSRKKYKNQLCLYKGEELTLNALCERFRKAGVEHPTLEAKKYLISEE